jgi:phosphoribosyl 1,2-cyclic phosphodiesterase
MVRKEAFLETQSMAPHNIGFSVLASGSSGNACFIQSGHANILVDAGLSGREIERRLSRIGVAADDLDALILTHEHWDHVKGAGPLSRRFAIPVYSTRGTFEKGMKVLGDIERPIPIQTGQTLTLKDLEVETFTKCHDAADPFGVIVNCNGMGIGVATDLGRITTLVEDRLANCSALILEFNHDLQMLEQGPYPLELKRRIKGPEGHLSNEQGADLLGVVAHHGLRHVVLAHLSEINNDEAKARNEAVAALEKGGLDGVAISVSRQNEVLPMIEL